VAMRAPIAPNPNTATVVIVELPFRFEVRAF
jgi:hypothetical protein